MTKERRLATGALRFSHSERDQHEWVRDPKLGSTARAVAQRDADAKIIRSLPWRYSVYPPIPDGKRLVFRPYITVKGVRIYAKKFGKRAFPILIDA